MKHQFIVEAECDGRYASKQGQEALQEMTAGRVWTIDGIMRDTACAKVIDRDVVVISKAEYEQLKAANRHRDRMIQQDIDRRDGHEE